jgi:hypothetical protein
VRLTTTSNVEVWVELYLHFRYVFAACFIKQRDAFALTFVYTHPQYMPFPKYVLASIPTIWKDNKPIEYY